MVALLLLLPFYIVADGIAQGTMNMLMRRHVPMSEQKTVNFALHVLYPICYVLLALAIAAALSSLYVLLVAILLRAGLFDIVLNLTKHDLLFVVGSSALTDKAITGVAGWLHVSPSAVSGAIRVLSLVAAVMVALTLL